MSSTLVTESFKRLIEPTASTAMLLTAGAGTYTKAELNALAVTKLWNADGDAQVSAMRAVKGFFYGTAADNTTGHAFNIYGMFKISGNQEANAQYDVKLLYSGTFTMGSMVGKSTAGGVLTTERFADTIDSFTIAAYGTFTNAYMNSSTIAPFSPADNTIAHFGIQDGNNCAGYLVDLDAASGTVGCMLSRDV